MSIFILASHMVCLPKGCMGTQQLRAKEGVWGQSQQLQTRAIGCLFYDSFPAHTFGNRALPLHLANDASTEEGILRAPEASFVSVFSSPHPTSFLPCQVACVAFPTAHKLSHFH